MLLRALLGVPLCENKIVTPPLPPPTLAPVGYGHIINKTYINKLQNIKQPTSQKKKIIINKKNCMKTQRPITENTNASK